MSVEALHLVEARSCSWAALRSLALLTRGAERVRHRVALVGSAGADRAAAAGLGSADRLAAPSQIAEAARPGLARFIRARGAPDIIVAWSASTAALAALGAPRVPRAVVLGTPPPAFDRSLGGFRRARALRTAALLIPSSRWLRDLWVARFTLLGAPSRALSLPHATLDPDRRARLRREWDLPESTRLVVGLGEPEDAVDARELIFLAGVLAVAGVPTALLTCPGAGDLERGLRFAEFSRPVIRVMVDDRPLDELLPACDLGVWIDLPAHPSLGHRPGYSLRSGVQSLAWAAHAGLPVVAQDHPASREVLIGAPRAHFAPDRQRRTMTGAMLDALSAFGPFETADSAESIARWRSRLDTELIAAAGTRVFAEA
ncbi:MAG: hypothetical protein SFZ24_09180 [Planctomycetota bacterium]|nr:hypothetical protein [Planctomycetota bacterium]